MNEKSGFIHGKGKHNGAIHIWRRIGGKQFEIYRIESVKGEFIVSDMMDEGSFFQPTIDRAKFTIANKDTVQKQLIDKWVAKAAE